MRNPRYLLAAVAIGVLTFLPQPTSATPLAAGLTGANSAVSETSGLVEIGYKKHHNKHYEHHYRHRRHHRFYDDDDDYYYPYFSYYPYCDDYYYGYCGYPRHHRRHPGFIFISPYFSFGF
jgi:hypothetical protein